MKKLLIVILVMVTLLTACAPTMYGVPQESWDRMSEPERIEAIRVYEREQQARRQAAEERARREAQAREQARARQAALEQERRERIEAIHRGQGAYGELIRVRLQGGRIRIGGAHHRYEPLTFTIADSETRKIAVADKKGREVDLVVTYAGGALAIEGIRFPYDRSWGRGALFTNTDTAGPLELRGVDVFIKVHNRSARHEREVHRMVVIREEPAPVLVVRDRVPLPSRVEVSERERPRPRSVIVPEREPVKQVPPAVDHPPRLVDVALLSGEMKVRGEKLKLERSFIRIAEGETRELMLKAGAELGGIIVSYRNGELTLDGAARKGRDAVRLPFVTDWKTGRIYQIAFKGSLHLEKLEVKVTGVAGK